MTKLPAHKTKIVCTIGPASESPDMMRKLLEAGMNVARLNFSHGDFAGHAKVVANLRAAAKDAGRRIAILADLPGPKMRIGTIKDEPVDLIPGATFTMTTEEIIGDAARVSVSFTRLPQAVKPGDILFLNDGLIQLEVVSSGKTDVACRVVVGGELHSRKGLNLPGIDLGISAFTERDRECLKFASEQGIDAVSQSFVESAKDIEAVRAAADAMGYHPFIIAKIERSNALDLIDGILAAADGLMVARGDLGVEIPIEQIALVQKQLIQKANLYGKPVITATQMLESMTGNRRPTRAESTDVANAILDGTDCVMLSGESAMGSYPVEAVSMLAKIAAAIEPHRRTHYVRDTLQGTGRDGTITLPDMIAMSVETTFHRISPAAVFVPTHSGYTARSITRFRLPVWIIAVSSQEPTCQNLQFSYGVYPVCTTGHPVDWTEHIRAWVRTHGIDGELAILTEGPSAEFPNTNNRMEIIELGQKK
jgi:pyruvate kinase